MGIYSDIAFITDVNGTCGRAIGLPSSINVSSVISVRGSYFRNKPTDACTIAMWIKLEDNSGIHKLFYTKGKDKVRMKYFNP